MTAATQRCSHKRCRHEIDEVTAVQVGIFGGFVSHGDRDFFVIVTSKVDGTKILTAVAVARKG